MEFQAFHSSHLTRSQLHQSIILDIIVLSFAFIHYILFVPGPHQLLSQLVHSGWCSAFCHTERSTTTEQDRTRNKYAHSFGMAQLQYTPHSSRCNFRLNFTKFDNVPGVYIDMCAFGVCLGASAPATVCDSKFSTGLMLLFPLVALSSVLNNIEVVNLPHLIHATLFQFPLFSFLPVFFRVLMKSNQKHLSPPIRALSRSHFRPPCCVRVRVHWVCMR